MNGGNNEGVPGSGQGEQPAQPPSSPGSGPSGASPWSDYFDRAKKLARQHPAGVAAVAAGAGLLFATQFTIGALAGVGVAMIAGKKMGSERREELLRKSEEMLRQTKEQGERVFEQGKAQAEQLLRRGRQAWPFRRRDAGKGGPTPSA
jgi:hypothetical protein